MTFGRARPTADSTRLDSTRPTGKLPAAECARPEDDKEDKEGRSKQDPPHRGPPPLHRPSEGRVGRAERRVVAAVGAPPAPREEGCSVVAAGKGGHPRGPYESLPHHLLRCGEDGGGEQVAGDHWQGREKARRHGADNRLCQWGGWQSAQQCSAEAESGSRTESERALREERAMVHKSRRNLHNRRRNLHRVSCQPPSDDAVVSPCRCLRRGTPIQGSVVEAGAPDHWRRR